jgi:hypothetical protein
MIDITRISQQLVAIVGLGYSSDYQLQIDSGRYYCDYQGTLKFCIY